MLQEGAGWQAAHHRNAPDKPSCPSDHSQDGEGESGREPLAGGHLVGTENDESAGRRGAEHHHDLRGLDQGNPPLVVALLGTDLHAEGKEWQER